MNERAGTKGTVWTTPDPSQWKPKPDSTEDKIIRYLWDHPQGARGKQVADHINWSYGRTYALLRQLDTIGLVEWQKTEVGRNETWWKPRYTDLPASRDEATLEEWLA